MCDKIATSKEHAPPKCFFPEFKDIPDKNYRINLITVPSCDEHNSKKSQNDSYILAVIAAHFENNKIATNHYATKILQSLNNDLGLQRVIKKSSYKVAYKEQQTLALLIDMNRFFEELSNITRAIYFNKYSEKLISKIQIHIPQMLNEYLEVRNDVKAIANVFETLIAGCEYEGENPEIFSFKLFRIPNPHLVVYKMLFYEKFEIYAFSSEETFNGF